MTATIGWLTQLPMPQASAYRLNSRYGIKRTEMSDGKARHRRVYTKIPDIFEVEWVMNKTQFSIFEAFYNYDLDQGVKWFNMSHYVGAGIVEGEFRFFEPRNPYKVSMLGTTQFIVKAKLERRERILITQHKYHDLIGRTDYDSILHGNVLVFGPDNNQFLTADNQYWSFN